MDDSPKKKTRFLRFGFRTLLIVFTIACIWIGYYAIRAQRQDAAAQSFREQGCNVYIAQELQSTSFFTFDQTGTNEVMEDNGKGITLTHPNFVAASAPETTARKLLGAKYFDRFTSVSLHESSKIKLSQIQTNLTRMPWIENVFIAMPLQDPEIEILKSQFPEIRFSRTRNHPHLQILGELNDLDNDELYYFNNPKLADDQGIRLTEATLGSIDYRIKLLGQLGYTPHWNNENRRYELDTRSLKQ